MSTDNVEDGGDISSGYGDSTETGQVSDERAEEMLRARKAGKDATTPDASGDATGES